MSTDLRAIHYREIRNHLNTMRLRVHSLLGLFPRGATGSELAEYSSLPVTSLRPRLTELFEMGLASVNGERRQHQHVYHYVSLHDAEARRRAEQEATHAGAQMSLLNA
jgi:transcription initiation factor IIE alpha subunit